ncbi:recombinase family protein [Vibrio vulnificus]|uniref:recombinase family protein n=1 Tax=Vibrio vulnificus TaxID=672 RepID=UPI002B4604B7|nr:recombinase family protein [Vibrio vulnificus]
MATSTIKTTTELLDTAKAQLDAIAKGSTMKACKQALSYTLRPFEGLDVVRSAKTKSAFVEALEALVEMHTEQEPESDAVKVEPTVQQVSLTRIYLRASTDGQDASRAKEELIAHAKAHGLVVAGCYQENVSGTSLNRPELERLIADSKVGDVLLIEKVDRLARFPHELWKGLKARIESKGVVIRVADQPMTHVAASNDMAKVLTNFMLDLAASMAHDDYETRRKRQAQGIAKAKAEGKYKGKQANTEQYKNILELLDTGWSWGKIAKQLKCGKVTIQRAIAWRDSGN